MFRNFEMNTYSEIAHMVLRQQGKKSIEQTKTNSL